MGGIKTDSIKCASAVNVFRQPPGWVSPTMEITFTFRPKIAMKTILLSGLESAKKIRIAERLSKKTGLQKKTGAIGNFTRNSGLLRDFQNNGDTSSRKNEIKILALRG